ncbi:MAG: COG1470 family protein, partial [Planctomycetota bacterium]
MRKKINWMTRIDILVGLVICSVVVPAWAVSNNGFETDWVYATNRYNKSCTNTYKGAICVFDDTTLELQLAFPAIAPPTSEWVTLTFSGTGSNDARLFVARTNALPNDIASDIELAELDSSGNVVGSIKLLSSLTNGPPPLVPGPTSYGVLLGNLRHSIYHGTLFLSLLPDSDEAVIPIASKVYEIDLGLTTVLNSYTGPTCLGTGTSGDRPFISLNPNDGTVYISGPNANEATNTGLGDLVALDTVVSPGTITTLIDGTTYSSGDTDWLRPACPVYRGLNNPDAPRPTIVQTIETDSGVANAALEFYLDANDGNFPPAGNLIKQGSLHTSQKRSWRGQLDEYNGRYMAVRRDGGSGCGNQGGIDQVPPDNSGNIRPTSSDNLYRKHGWWDVASPGFRITGVLPIGQVDRVASPNGPADPVELKIRHKGYTCSDTNVNGTVTYTVVKVPDDASTAWLTLDSSGGSLTPGTVDTVTGTIDTTGLAPGVHTVDVQFTDDATPVNVYTRTISLEIQECTWTVTPESTQDSTVTGDITVWGNCQDPQDYDFTVTCLGGFDVSYTVQEVLSDGVTGTDYPWLDLAKTSGGPIPAGSSDTLTVTVTSDNTTKEGYVRFVPSCGSASSGVTAQVRKIEVTTLQTDDAPPNDKSFQFAYLGDVDPETADSCGYIPPDADNLVGGCSLVVHTEIGGNPNPGGTVVDDPDAQNGKAYYISQAETGRQGYKSHIEDATGDVDDFLQAKLGFTMVARLKVQYNMNAGGMIWAWSRSRTHATDPVRQTPKAGWVVGWGGSGPSHTGKLREFQILTPPYDDINDRTTAQLATTLEEQQAYHIIRVVNGFGIYGNRTLAIYYDEQTDPVLFLDEGVLGPTNANGGSDSFCFGTFGNAAIADVWFDWISFTNRGMYAPGEEDDCIGSLIPAFPPPCNTPFADTDNDGDVDQGDFALFQQCYSGDGNVHPDPPDYCRCLNRDGER